MNGELIWVLVLLAGCVAMFVANRPRADVVALLVLILLPLSGVITVPEALAGFSDPNVLLIAALFVIGAGLVRTGVSHHVGDWLIRKAGKSEKRLLVLLMLSVSALGAFMSSTGVVAVFIPVVLSITRHLRISPSRLMMPLSFAGLISGMLTLVATAPNMVVDSTLKHAGRPGFSFFSFTPIGLVVLAMGIGYMLVARRWLGGKTEATQKTGRRGLTHLIQEYHLETHGRRLRILPGSPLDGHQLKAVSMRADYGCNVVAVDRKTGFRRQLFNPGANMVLQAGDILLVDVSAAEALEKMEADLKLQSQPLSGHYFMQHSREVGMAEVLVPPESALIGKSIIQATFRRKYGLTVVGLRRSGKALQGSVLDEKLKLGDVILVVGPWTSIRKLQSQVQDFIVLSLPADVEEVAPAASQAFYAVLCLAIMVTLMVTGLVPNVLAAFIACLLMGAFGCVTMDTAYKSIHWQSLVLIVGMMPFARALEITGGVDLAVQGLSQLTGGAGPRVLIGSLFVLTAGIGLFISNTATAVLMAPIALSMASHLGLSPYPFAMTVAIAASCSFMTPVSSPVNTLVLGPGQYRFGDFVKVGVPFTLLVLLVTVLLVPLLFPLKGS
ncbi:SLC13 family permease [Roseimicrobium sp. ORNL1]|uniref:SLC13 family permease n=1 Tax=Roseimicrobium sp. ORNL1 TaxID=2711231 RepID=UPI0013E11626|nr:SLC13 family permease [Roseimicrobium sp. ORNL1]QIF05590.1 SLC13 family permease [Roseimicrobium sp. ORNL1]